jgi:1-acyl-sn-glycerol-3-phosphate acyltransferase
MIYPQSNRLIHWIVDTYIKSSVTRHFYKINFNPGEIDQNKSILLVANHFSIWDGLILYWITRNFLGKKFHVMLLEETSKKEPFLKYVGAFSVSKGSRSILQSIDYAAQLLTDPQNLVLIFPQGALYSNFVNDVKFEQGIIKIMQKASNKFQLLYAATFTENFQHKKPTANVYLTQATNCTFEDIAALNADYQQHYNAARQRQTQIVL